MKKAFTIQAPDCSVICLVNQRLVHSYSDFLVGKPDRGDVHLEIRNNHWDKPLLSIVQAANTLRKELLARAR